MGQKHKFRESQMPFSLRDMRKNSSQHERTCAEGDGAICSRNRKIVPYHEANPNTRNGACLRSPSLLMWRSNCALLVCDRIYSLLNNDAKYLWVDGTGMMLEKLNIIQTIMDKSSCEKDTKKICFVKRMSFSISNFDVSTPSPLLNVVTTWKIPRSVLQH